MTLNSAVARRNQLVTVAMVFSVFTGFAFVLPFLPLYVRELGVEEPQSAALWAGPRSRSRARSTAGQLPS